MLIVVSILQRYAGSKIVGLTPRWDFALISKNLCMIALAGLTVRDCQRAAYVVEVLDSSTLRIYGGAASINYALQRLPGRVRVGWRLLGRFYLPPLIRQVEELVYTRVARNRFRISRTERACSNR